ncbi:integrase [Vreelandella alkaliphila]|uniref:Integrase n=1 Tax=Vreelandella alkaliphila TaxID=272774 RepID=A0ABX4HIZ2_9GAMM|nr:integrase [Halomonas humidisoli]PAU72442.1 integrase [Halomonas humidisoli]
MASLIQFIPQKDLTAQKNLQNLISLSRDQLTLWADQPGFSWENSSWRLLHMTIRFTNHEHRKLHWSKTPEPHQLMHPAFIDVAKAYLRYHHTVNPKKGIRRAITTLRILEMVLRQDMDVPDITRINQRHFDLVMAALRIDKQRQSIASDLLYILKTLADFFIVTSGVYYWKHPYVGTASYNFTNGTHADAETKSAKLPNQDTLLAIAEVFSRGHTQELEDVDIMITSITCLLLSVPMRISEILRLRVDCLRSGTDKDAKVQYHLNYWTPKIKEFVPKAIPTIMSTNTLAAVERLKRITEEGRRLARYMEGNPTKFFRHEHCPDVPDDQQLTPIQVIAALGLLTRKSCASFIHRHTGRYSLTGFTLDSLWQLVLAEHRRLNPYFPYQEPVDIQGYKPLKMSESLTCCRRLQFGARNSTSPVLLAPFKREHFRNRLSKPFRKRDKAMCFFSRHGFEVSRLTSHSLRHLLNRLARKSGVTIDTITTWSSRASDKQSLTYLNDDPQEAASKGAALLGMQQDQTHKAPITDEEAEFQSQGPFHRSRYGLCRRSWRAGPCNRFADCLNCSELLICKGDKLAAGAVAKDREHLVRTLNGAKAAVENGERAASRWMLVAEPQIERLNQLLKILNDERIPDGSPVELSDSTDFSHEQVLVDDKAASKGVKLLDRRELGIEYGNELLACLDLLRNSDNA